MVLDPKNAQPADKRRPPAGRSAPKGQTNGPPVPGGPRASRWITITTHLVALAPLVVLLWAWATGGLGANPIREITLRTGRYALFFLMLSLACTPARILTGWAPIGRLRKPLGLYAFLYVALHLLAYVGLDYGFNLAFIWPEVTQRPFIQVGLLAFLLLLPLAVTSTRWWIKRLGKNWKRLHRLVYLAAVLAVLHFFWLVKGDWRRPLAYAALLSLLLLARTPPARKALGDLRARAQGKPKSDTKH